MKNLKNKNRKAWILPHCLSTQKKVEIVDFDAAAFNGGIINPGKILPSDLGRRVPRDKRLPHERTIKVSKRIQGKELEQSPPSIRCVNTECTSLNQNSKYEIGTAI